MTVLCSICCTHRVTFFNFQFLLEKKIELSVTPIACSSSNEHQRSSIYPPWLHVYSSMYLTPFFFVNRLSENLTRTIKEDKLHHIVIIIIIIINRIHHFNGTCPS